MITTLVGQFGTTYHATNRDNSGALCRSNLKPRTFMNSESTTGWIVKLHRLPGDTAERAEARGAVNCTPCLRKLEKITAEAFDAATAEDIEINCFARLHATPPAAIRPSGHPSYADQTVTPAEVGACNAADYTTADTLEAVGQRVYLYDAQSDSTVAGNVVAVVGQQLDVLVVEAWSWSEGRFRKVTFYPTRVRSGDQLRAAVETPSASPFPVGSRVAAHMSQRVYTVDSVEVGPHDGVTRVYLVHPDGERLAVRPSVLAKMFALALPPFPNADHLIGERVTLPSADPRQSVGTISGTVARVRPAPRGARHAVAELESGYLVSLSAALAEATNPRGTVSYRLRNTRTGATYRVLGTGPAENAPHLTAVWVQREGEQGATRWDMDTMMSPYYDLEAVDRDGNPPPRR